MSFSGFTVRTQKCNDVSLPPHTQTHQRGHTFGLHPVKNTHSLGDKANIFPLQIRSGPHKNFKALILSDCYRCRTESPALMQLVEGNCTNTAERETQRAFTGVHYAGEFR